MTEQKPIFEVEAGASDDGREIAETILKTHCPGCVAEAVASMDEVLRGFSNDLAMNAVAVQVAALLEPASATLRPRLMATFGCLVAAHLMGRAKGGSFTTFHPDAQAGSEAAHVDSAPLADMPPQGNA